MSTPMTAVSPRPMPRHALGLPAGSIRALLALAVLGLLWLMTLGPLWRPELNKLPLSFIYLQFLMILILAHYFSAHGSTIGPAVSTRSPLGLPRGSVRFLLLVGYGGLAYYLYRHQNEYELPKVETIQDFITLLALLLAAFFIGHYLTLLVRMFSGGTLPFWFQDVQAWIALLAILGLAALMIIHVFINPNVNPDVKVGTLPLDQTLAALVGFYFGSRS
jgi:hypothetical protein